MSTPSSLPRPDASASIAGAAAPRRSSAIDVTITILLIVTLVISSIALSVAGLLGGAFAADGCVSGSCELVSAGFTLALFGPLVWALAAIVPAIVFMALRRPAWWIPLAGLGGATLTWLIGSALMSA